MGRKNKVSKDDSDSEEESEYEEEEIVPLLSVIIQDNQDVLVDIMLEYRDYDSRYNNIGVPEINKYVEDIVYLNQPYVDYCIPEKVRIDDIMYRFITDIIDTMDLEYDPIIDEDEDEDENLEQEPKNHPRANPITDIQKSYYYLNRCFTKHFL